MDVYFHLEATFQRRERSDCGRSALKTVGVGLLHILKFPVWIVLTILSAVLIEPLAYFAKSSDKELRSLATRSIQVYSFAVGFEYGKNIEHLGKLAKKGDNKAVKQLVKIAKASSGKLKKGKYFLNIPPRENDPEFYKFAMGKLENYALLTGKTSDKAIDQLVALCSTIEGDLPQSSKADDAMHIGVYKLDMDTQMIARHAIWKECNEDYAGCLYDMSADILGDKFASFMY